MPSDKTTDAVSEKATVGDRESMAFSGTMVVSGRATGVVVATGSETELGRINQLLAGVSALETPLLRQIKKFGYAITAVIAVVGVIVFAYGRWVQGMDFVEMFQAVIGIAVSVIPEGLPALITITLAIGVQRMAQRNAIIRRLPAVETLGLGIAHLLGQDRHADAHGNDGGVGRDRRGGYQGHRRRLRAGRRGLKDGKPAGKDPVLELMGRVSLLCNDAELFQARRGLESGGRSDRGGALPVRATSSGSSGRPSRRPIRGSTPSRSNPNTGSWRRCTRRRRRARSCSSRARPKSILEHCDRQQDRGRTQAPLDRAHFERASDKLAGQGERVLALAWLEDPGRQGRQPRSGRSAEEPGSARA